MNLSMHLGWVPSGFLKKPISFLEIGIFKGGSIPMWKDYFPDGSRLTFIDIDPACKAFEIEGTNVRIGNQADPEFLTSLAEELGPFDVVLDDRAAGGRGIMPEPPPLPPAATVPPHPAEDTATLSRSAPRLKASNGDLDFGPGPVPWSIARSLLSRCFASY